MIRLLNSIKYIVGKGGMVVVETYKCIAPTALPFFMPALTPWPPLRSDHELRIWRTKTGLS